MASSGIFGGEPGVVRASPYGCWMKMFSMPVAATYRLPCSAAMLMRGELFDDLEQLALAAGHVQVGDVLAVHDDPRHRGDLQAAIEEVGALQLRLHREGRERLLELLGA